MFIIVTHRLHSVEGRRKILCVSWEHLEQIPTIRLTFVQATFVLVTSVHNRNISAVTDSFFIKQQQLKKSVRPYVRTPVHTYVTMFQKVAQIVACNVVWLVQLCNIATMVGNSD